MSKRGLQNRVEDLENRSPHGSQRCRRWIAAVLDPPLTTEEAGSSLEEAAEHCDTCREKIEKLDKPLIWEENPDD
ncbi:MAG: hypothetical protein MAG715_00424 [Methanonatronarchaeales archaeon]|nr:hypothetical protein [Methanonatronarchaeales archaeon]